MGKRNPWHMGRRAGVPWTCWGNADVDAGRNRGRGRDTRLLGSSDGLIFEHRTQSVFVDGLIFEVDDRNAHRPTYVGLCALRLDLDDIISLEKKEVF